MNSIYRRALIVLIALASFSTLQAKVVDRSEALETATAFLRSHSSVAVLSASNVKEVWNSNQLSAAGVAIASASSAPTFYVFAPETGTGFVIVSGDDATESILGYSDESAFETEDMPCTFLSWCEAMDNQIAHYRQTGTVSARKTARENGVATLASETVELNSATWGQDAPFYNDCPMDGSSRSVTGCVATSFAIAMYYHKHPTTGKGQTEAYYTETKNIYVESRDLSSHTYDWSNMLDSYDGSYTSTQASAVATLMADIGAALKADYTSSSTGIVVGQEVTAEFYEHFGYAPNTFFATSSYYDEDSWTALMEDQIKNVGPVPYSCLSMVHQFILDGYNTSDQFHVNWGWNGYDNGWYLLPEIETGGNTQYAYVDFAPDDGNTGCVLKLIEDGISASVTTFQQNGQFTMNGMHLVNYSPIDFTGNLCVVLTDSQGNIKETISPEIHFENISYFVTLGVNNFSCAIEGEISVGDRIRVAYKDDSVDHWKLSDAEDPSSTVDYIEMTSSNIGEPVEYEYSVLMFGDGLTTSTTTFAKNASFNIAAIIGNFSSKDIDLCYYKVALCDENGDTKEWISDEWTQTSFGAGYAYTHNKSCVIRGDIEAGDRIRVYYQVDNNIEGHWKLIEGNGDAPWEIVISEDQIGEPVTPYNISVYDGGVTVGRETFYTGVSFNTNVSFVSWDGDVNVKIKVAHLDSNGNVKEWISEEVDKGTVSARAVWSSGNILCTIWSEVEAGDIIRPYYQGDNDGDWWMFGEYNNQPRQVEITESMIGTRPAEREYTVYIYSGDPMTTATHFYPGATFTVNTNFTISGDLMDVCVAKVALTDSEGNIKEFISEGTTFLSPLVSNMLYYLSNVECTITSDVEAGDRIRVYYQADNYDTWYVMKEYYGSAWEIVITESMTKAPSRAIEDGEYLIVNAEGYYLGGGLTWGVTATTLGKPQFIGFTMQDDYTYHLDSHQYDGENGHYLNDNLYFDKSTPADWTVEEVEGGYTIHGTVSYDNQGSKTGYLTSNGFQTAATLEEEPYVWKLLTMDDVIASMDEATSDVPVDVTALVQAPELKRHSSTSYYETWSITGYDGTGTPSNYAFGDDGGSTSNCAESNNSTNGFNFSQDITLPKAGYYTLSAQGFYRVDNSSSPSLPVLYAGDETAEFPELDTSASSMADAYQEFLQGLHPVGPILIEATENETLNIGFKGEDTGLWVVMGEVELLYYGDIPESIEWTMADVEWGTLILPFDAEVPDDWTAYSCPGLEDDNTTLILEKAETIEACTPYILSGKAGTYSFSGVAANTEDSYSAGLLVGTLVDMTYEDFTPNSGQYVLQKHADEGLAFYQITENSVGLKLAAYHCYLTPGVEVTSLRLPGVETGIKAVEGDLIANDAIYDLSGRKVSKAVKGGVYIINGKKVLVK